MTPFFNFFKNIGFGPLFPMPEPQEEKIQEEKRETPPATTTQKTVTATAPIISAAPPPPPPPVTRSFAKIKEDYRILLVKAFGEMNTQSDELEQMSLEERVQFVKGAFLEAFKEKTDSDLMQILEGKNVTFKNQESKIKQTLFQEAIDSPKKIFLEKTEKKRQITGKSPRFDVKVFIPVVTAYLVAQGKTEAQITKLLENRQEIAMQFHFVQDEVKKALKAKLTMLKGDASSQEEEDEKMKIEKEMAALQDEIIIEEIVNNPDKLLQEYNEKRAADIKKIILTLHLTEQGVPKGKQEVEIDENGDEIYKTLVNKKKNPEEALNIFLEKHLLSLAQFDQGKTTLTDLAQKVIAFVVETTGMKEETVTEELSNRTKLLHAYQDLRHNFSTIKSPKFREPAAKKLPMTEARFKALLKPENQAQLQLFLKENEQINSLLLDRLAKEPNSLSNLSLVQQLFVYERNEAKETLLTQLRDHFFDSLQGQFTEKAKAIQFYAYLQHYAVHPEVSAPVRERYSSLLNVIEADRRFIDLQRYL